MCSKSLDIHKRVVLFGYIIILGGSIDWFINICPWWRHQIETFSVLLALCAGNSPVTGEFSAQRPVMRNFDVFFDLRLNKRLSKQWWGWWFETPPLPLWRHSNAGWVASTGAEATVCPSDVIVNDMLLNEVWENNLLYIYIYIYIYILNKKNIRGNFLRCMDRRHWNF